MGMFCEKCGNKLKPGAAFCEACGARVKISEINNAHSGNNSNGTSSYGACNGNTSAGNIGKSGMGIAAGGDKKGKSSGVLAGVVVLLVLLGGGWYYYQNYMNVVPSSIVTDDVNGKKTVDVSVDKDERLAEKNEKIEETPLEKAQKQLSDKGVKGTVIASTIEKNNNSGYLSIVKNG